MLDETFGVLGRVLESHHVELQAEEVGTVSFVGHGIARVRGLPGVRAEELLRFPGDLLGMAFNVDVSEVGVILLDESAGLGAGAEVRRTERVLEVPVGEALLGRVVDAVGRPLDHRGPVRASQRRPVERSAPVIMERAPVTVPLQTGLKVVDALIPVGRGQRELILGDRQTGKTAIALDTIINQRDKGVLCVYCAIGQQSSAVAKVIADLRQYQALDTCLVVVASGKDPPGLQFVAPYTAMTMAEYFMDQGHDALVVFDDLTHHARAYRELSLLLRRPPGREAYPGDIFYIHSRLLERSTHLRDERGGGSLTALPIIETEAQNISAYIPTNLISITDGQIYLSPELFQKGVLPAVDAGKSVSRVGGKTQLPAYRTVASSLRLAYAQFEELEGFARFGTRLDEETRQTLEHGRRVRETFKQPQYEPIPAAEQIAILVAVNAGVFEGLPLQAINWAERAIRAAVRARLPRVCARIEAAQRLSDDDLDALVHTARAVLAPQPGELQSGND
ncbi:MAG TPA: alternate F1F0 ATPase, F1 subunit alpha [Candidatus Tectomicrobia bacterium]|nr:alternate F1F0 ATPase, F1 subunit alpha [Candidatus Tectomicrobia bacterium]